MLQKYCKTSCETDEPNLNAAFGSDKERGDRFSHPASFARSLLIIKRSNEEDEALIMIDVLEKLQALNVGYFDQFKISWESLLGYINKCYPSKSP